ncbi:carboxylate-amine ligase [Alkalitalea saponilacus]|uniref:Carboxylate-amine ligase n=1 Tax=Alkalitalea saponilacus TaxID=889453 RepID=A0A1T5HB53_9BACT|nr:glutamate-cysteine ligase family protein [Alkalitalea saponilacus]ASB50781.1 glutamate--cysteine ligase [Alkalitalea saponilacus]SKC17912.1 carboxylate-amine ligase [Alkalitalea saponilacus]
MAETNKYNLFDVFGVELEYMIVDKSSLNVKPLCDVLMKEVTGAFLSDFENGAIAWSNELVNHVVELKTNGPASELCGLSDLFHQNIKKINSLLEKHDAILMPGGSHPWMNPFEETRLWEHDYNAIYALYNRIFDCRGHGWSNLQSTHINLPFNGNDEFARLHAAIRVVLPLIPALCASSPIMDGKFTGFSDGRLEAYRHNQVKIPVIAGKIIPEQAFSEADYYKKIFNPIKAAIKPFDDEGILEHHFLNSRGAIARFDRGAIEIRLIDIQECPKADLAFVELIVAVLRLLVNEVFEPLEVQKSWKEDVLAEMLISAIKKGEKSLIDNKEYLQLYGISEKISVPAGDVWKHLFNISKSNLSTEAIDVLTDILHHGTLSSRILRAVNDDYSPDNLQIIYAKLTDCLIKNQLFT